MGLHMHSSNMALFFLVFILTYSSVSMANSCSLSVGHTTFSFPANTPTVWNVCSKTDNCAYKLPEAAYFSCNGNECFGLYLPTGKKCTDDGDGGNGSDGNSGSDGDGNGDGSEGNGSGSDSDYDGPSNPGVGQGELGAIQYRVNQIHKRVDYVVELVNGVWVDVKLGSAKSELGFERLEDLLDTQAMVNQDNYLSLSNLINSSSGGSGSGNTSQIEWQLNYMITSNDQQLSVLQQINNKMDGIGSGDTGGDGGSSGGGSGGDGGEGSEGSGGNGKDYTGLLTNIRDEVGALGKLIGGSCIDGDCPIPIEKALSDYQIAKDKLTTAATEVKKHDLHEFEGKAGLPAFCSYIPVFEYDFCLDFAGFSAHMDLIRMILLSVAYILAGLIIFFR